MDLKHGTVEMNHTSNYINKILKRNWRLSIQNFKQVCRFCLRKNANNNIYEITHEKILIFNICKQQLSLPLQSTDVLPKNICGNCLDKIKEYATFRKTIVETEILLLNINQNNEKDLDKFQPRYEISSNNDDSTGNSCAGITTRNITCKSCNIFFNTMSEYKIHNKIKHRKQNLFLPCTICKKQFKKATLKKHQNMHAKSQLEYKFQCDVCGRNYQTKRNLSRHYLSHTGMPYVCDICGKGFREANLLKDHLNIHNGVSPYLCGLCGKCYPTGSALRLHKAYKHEGKKRKSYKCYSKSEKRTMIKSQKGSFPCEICGKIYGSRTIVNYHVLTHNSEKKFQCNDCGKMFANKSILGDHRRIHRLSYKCKFCDKSFAYAASLETHINSHTGEKPHKCTICEKRYSNKSHLKEHIRIHTGERPYICNICGKTFAVKGNLNGHIKTHLKSSNL